jgi:hypothetical protein
VDVRIFLNRIFYFNKKITDVLRHTVVVRSLPAYHNVEIRISDITEDDEVKLLL